MMPNVISEGWAAATEKQRYVPDYQKRDSDIIDYHEFKVPGCDIKFRGPALDPTKAKPGSYFTCIGSAHTYGCYFPNPFPALVSKKLGMPALNLGVGGASHGFYAQYDALIDAMNRGRFVVLQCTACRQESNSRFEADGYVEYVKERKTGESMDSSVAWKRIVDQEPENALRYVQECRASFIETSRTLIEKIKVPVVFLWFSTRTPDYKIDEAAVVAQSRARAEGKDQSHFVDGLSGSFPHFVDGPTASAIAALCKAKAEAITSRGINHPIISQITGKPVGPLSQESGLRDHPEWSARRDGINRYYPSMEMHEDAAAALLPVVTKLVHT